MKINANELKAEYVDKRLSIQNVADKFGLTYGQVKVALMKAGVKLRDHSDALRARQGDVRWYDERGNKRCTSCKRYLSLEAFGKSTLTEDGLNTYCKRCNKSHVFKYKYGITIDDYEATIEAQNGKCDCCGRELELANPKKVSVDHDHKTGKTRGIVCQRCNVMLALLDDEEALQNALSYTRKHKSS